MGNADAHMPPDAGDFVDLGGLGVHFKARGEQTGGRFAIVEHPIEAGVLVDPHIHQHEDELSYVLEGTVWARVGEQEIEAVAGSYIWKPRNVLHTFWNPGPGPARILEVISPAGFEHLFEEVAALLERPSASTESRFTDCAGTTVSASTAPGSRTWKQGSGRCASSRERQLGRLGWLAGARWSDWSALGLHKHGLARSRSRAKAPCGEGTPLARASGPVAC